MKRLIVMAVLFAGTAMAQGWQVLDGAGITATLTDRTVTYAGGATQHFYASGRTLYTFGEPSWGQWRVQADRYCSLWPPAPTWDCYDVEGDGAGGINFRDEGGNEFPGEIVAE